MTGMVTGIHALIFSREAEQARTFFRDVLGFKSVDAGGGWLIFALPPAELGIHPTASGAGNGRHELYLMCDDIAVTVEELTAQGVEFVEPITDQGFGLMTALAVPGGGTLGLYEPRHPTANTLNG